MFVVGESVKRKLDAARIDTEIVAFHVSAEEAETIGDYLVSVIVTKCLTEFGGMPEILE